MLIRPVDLESEFDAVFELNRASFTEAWSESGLYCSIASGMDCLVAIQDEQICGYLLSQDLLDEVEIMQLAVSACHRRQGTAEALVRQLLESKSSMQKVMLEVRESNYAARSLYEKLGFTVSGIRKGYYQPKGPDTQAEDAVLMAYQFS